jgi:hypothetical protein
MPQWQAPQRGQIYFSEPGSIEKIIAHGVLGGMTSAMQGGNFFEGMIGAAAAQGLAPLIDTHLDFSGAGGSFVRIMAAAVIGGTASVIAGGKFENGATSAAFAWMFNDELAKRDPDEDASFPEVSEKKWQRSFVDGKRVTKIDKYGDPQWRDLTGLGELIDKAIGKSLNLDFQVEVQIYGEFELWDEVSITTKYDVTFRSLNDYNSKVLSISSPVLTGRTDWRATGIVTDTDIIGIRACPISCSLVYP